MAASHLHAAPGPQNSQRRNPGPGDLTALAQGVQEQAQRITHLLGASDDALDDVEDQSSVDDEAKGRRHREALDRILLFNRMAIEAAQATQALGEEIEKTSFRLRQARSVSSTGEKVHG